MAHATSTETRPVVTTVEEPPQSAKVLGYIVEFADVDSLIHGCEQVRDRGFKRWDAHTPFPVHGLNEAMGLKPSYLQWIVLGAALTGLATAALLQLQMNAIGEALVGDFFAATPTSETIAAGGS